MARPNEVSTISAPSSCARFATEKAIDASLSTPVTNMRLSASSIVLGSPSEWRVRVPTHRSAIALLDQDLQRVDQYVTCLGRIDHRVDVSALGRAVGILES